MAESEPHRGVEQLVARRAHNPKVVGSSPTPATTKEQSEMVALFLLPTLLKAVFTDIYNQHTVCLVKLKRTYTPLSGWLYYITTISMFKYFVI